MRGADGVGVAGEMDVDLVFGDDARLAATGAATLDTKDRAQGRLAQVDHGLMAQPAEAIGQADGGSSLAFSSESGA